MDANLPEGQGPFPAVIVVHGGGWAAGDKLTYVSPVLTLLSEAHFTWFSIDYRLTPHVRNEEQLEDLRNAIRYVRAHAGRFNIDPNATSS
ncbi:MAG: alpha/beta hydrolase fold domain-containing protein [Bryobacteraceae bacterium]